MKCALVTDSAAGFTAQEAKQLDITVLPLPFQVGQQVCWEGIDLDYQQMIASVDEGNVPTPAPVPRERLVGVFQALQNEGVTDVLVIHLAGGINSLGANVQACVSQLPGLTFHIFDTNTAGLPEQQYVRYALRLLEQGQPLAQIVARLTTMRDQSQTLMIVDRMSQLAQMGYISNGATVMGNKLRRLKTVLMFNQAGKITAVETKSRIKRANQAVCDRIIPWYDRFGARLRITVMTCGDETSRFVRLGFFKEEFPLCQLSSAPMGAALAVYLGTDSIVVGCGPDYRQA